MDRRAGQQPRLGPIPLIRHAEAYRTDLASLSQLSTSISSVEPTGKTTRFPPEARDRVLLAVAAAASKRPEARKRKRAGNH